MPGGGIMSHVPELSEQVDFKLTQHLSRHMNPWLGMLSLDTVYQSILVLSSP